VDFVCWSTRVSHEIQKRRLTQFQGGFFVFAETDFFAGAPHHRTIAKNRIRFLEIILEALPAPSPATPKGDLLKAFSKRMLDSAAQTGNSAHVGPERFPQTNSSRSCICVRNQPSGPPAAAKKNLRVYRQTCRQGVGGVSLPGGTIAAGTPPPLGRSFKVSAKCYCSTKRCKLQLRPAGPADPWAEELFRRTVVDEKVK